MRVIVLLALAAALTSSADAQTTPPPAPPVSSPLVVSWPRFVVDARGATSGIPTDSSFYPPLPSDVLVPARGFGFDAGAHVYAGGIGPARLGFGANFVTVRATQGDSTTALARLLAPQVSFNFGSPRGWSYISGGAGVGTITGRFQAPGGESLERGSGTLTTINFGAGARWFFMPRVAFTFDLRMHRYGAGDGEPGVATPAGTMGAASVGVSFR